MDNMSIPNSRSPQAAPSSPPELQYAQWFRTMRQAAPVWRDPASGVWHVFRYDDAVAVLHDFHAFSSHSEGAGISAGDLISMDPPHHDQLRGLVSEVFTPRAIAQLEPRIRAVTDELLDQTESKTEVELIDDFAYPLPITVIAEMLGVPAADRAFFKRWSDQLHQRTQIEMASETSRGESAQLMLEFHDYLLGHVQARRQHARNDLLSGLVNAELDGRRLSDEEIAGFATILLIAGHVTVTAALGNAVLCLSEYPAVQTDLRAHPEKLPVAIEEVLRLRSPVPGVKRVAAHDVSLAGQQIARGEEVNVWLQSANRDEAAFPDPDVFVPARHPNRHLAFAAGVHFCLGAPLARLELWCALDMVLRRYSQIRVNPDRSPATYPRPLFRKLHLQVERT